MGKINKNALGKKPSANYIYWNFKKLVLFFVAIKVFQGILTALDNKIVK